MHQKILWGGSLGYKSILNFTFLTMKFSNSLHAIANLLSLLIRNLWNIHIQIWILTMVSQNLQCFKSQISNLKYFMILRNLYHYFIRRHTFCYFYWCSDYTFKKTFLLSLHSAQFFTWMWQLCLSKITKSKDPIFGLSPLAQLMYFELLIPNLSLVFARIASFCQKK